MSYPAVLSESKTTDQGGSGIDSDDALRCPLPILPRSLVHLTSDLCDILVETGCPLAPPLRDRLRFETLLAEVSATFVKLSAGQVDLQISSALRSLVVFLEIDRHRLVGEIFTNALARKRADEDLQSREESLRQARENLRKLAAKLLHAQEEERRRIAREMHDDWTQRLALLGIDIAKLEKHIGAPETALPLLRTMQENLVSLSEDVHALSRQLHPSILSDLGLVEALRSECASFSRREGIAVIYRPEEVPTNVPKDVGLCIYRVAQEALRNVAKHAAVSEARVSLVATGPDLLLCVEDKGVGFDVAGGHSQPGLGLSSMEERVHLIQATLSVTSAPGRGTSVEVRIPLPRSAP